MINPATGRVIDGWNERWNPFTWTKTADEAKKIVYTTLVATCHCGARGRRSRS
jgi:hypothetical protein